MRSYVYILLILTIILRVDLNAQEKQFIVKKAPFSSELNDEFSPVYYKGGLVFCSNIRDNTLIGYKQEKSRLYKIFYVANRDSSGWKLPKLLSKELTTDFNDGPATFTRNGNIIYYSRNNSIGNFLRDINDPSNKLGLYSAELVNDIWSGIKPFKYNNPLYSLCTPSLVPDGSRIYFSSDMPGGYGEMDLYYCDLGDDGWSTPVNLGPAINTPKNESFPFAGNYGKLYFASDGHKGFGRKDLFYSSEINGVWINPVHLDSAINSPADDFGLVTDSTFAKGYFSSNRLKTDDIFSFVSAPVQFTSCDSLKENNYCFTFYDERHQLIDTIPVTYLWDFGNGIKMTGTEAKYCFPGPGKYSVKLSIFDELTGSPIAEQVEYKVDLKDIEQAYINSYSIGIAGEPMSFDGSKTHLKNFRITDYIWNFGEGFKPGGQFMNRSFKNKGEYSVYLGLLGEKDSLGVIPKKCVTKRIRIYDKYQELELTGEGEDNTINGKIDSIGLHDKTMQIRLLFMNDLTERQKTKFKASLSELQKHVVSFNTTGILTSTYPFLDKIVEAMKGNPDVRLEIIVHSANAEVPGDSGRASEKYAQELAFFFRNRGLKKDVFHSRGFGSAPSVFIPVVKGNTISDGTIEFIFMKN